MQFSKALLLPLFILGATAFDHIYEGDEMNANDALDVRNSLQAAHDIAMRSTDPDLFRREVKSASVDRARCQKLTIALQLTSLAKRGCTPGGRGACIRGKCSTSNHFCHPNGCACD
jgi:hypothetical protein